VEKIKGFNMIAEIMLSENHSYKHQIYKELPHFLVYQCKDSLQDKEVLTRFIDDFISQRVNLASFNRHGKTSLDIAKSQANTIFIEIINERLGSIKIVKNKNIPTLSKITKEGLLKFYSHYSAIGSNSNKASSLVMDSKPKYNYAKDFATPKAARKLYEFLLLEYSYNDLKTIFSDLRINFIQLLSSSEDYLLSEPTLRIIKDHYCELQKLLIGGPLFKMMFDMKIMLINEYLTNGQNDIITLQDFFHITILYTVSEKVLKKKIEMEYLDLIVSELIDNGANKNFKDLQGRDIMDHSIALDNKDFIKSYYKNGAGREKNLQNIIIRICKAGKPSILEYLRDVISPDDINTLIVYEDTSGGDGGEINRIEYPLITEVLMAKNEECLKILISLGANINFTSAPKFIHPLNLLYAELEAFNLAIKYGADVNFQDQNQNTVLDLLLMNAAEDLSKWESVFLPIAQKLIVSGAKTNNYYLKEDNDILKLPDVLFADSVLNVSEMVLFDDCNMTKLLLGNEIS
jgi:ankyrin repeat protein